MAVTYQHVDPDGRFSFTDVDGSTVDIGGEPTDVDDRHAAYLDTVPHVRRAGKTGSPGGGEEE